MTEPKNKWKIGNIELTEWENKSPDGSNWSNYNLQRSYKNKEGEWENKNVSGFTETELKNLYFVLLKKLSQ